MERTKSKSKATKEAKAAMEIIKAASEVPNIDKKLTMLRGILDSILNTSGFYAVSVNAFGDHLSIMIHPDENTIIDWDGDLEEIEFKDIFVDGFGFMKEA